MDLLNVIKLGKLIVVFLSHRPIFSSLGRLFRLSHVNYGFWIP